LLLCQKLPSEYILSPTISVGTEFAGVLNNHRPDGVFCCLMEATAHNSGEREEMDSSSNKRFQKFRTGRVLPVDRYAKG